MKPSTLHCATRRAALTALASACAWAALPPSAFAQESYPTKPVRIVVAFPPGGSIDLVARLLAPKLQSALGQSVVVDNRPGASGNIGMDHVAKSAKDGYTLLMAHAGLSANAHMFAKLSYDPLKDIQPVIHLADQPNVLVLNPKWKFKDVKELVAYAKANPGKLSFGTSGIGGPQDVAARMFMQMTGVDMVNVAYKGGAPALQDLLGGQIDLMFETSPTAVPYAQSGKLHALAVTGTGHLSTIPNVPTVAEGGVPGYHYVGWMGLAAPAGTPAPIVKRLNEEVQKILATPEFKKQLQDVSLIPQGGSVEKFSQFVRQQSDYYAKLVKESGITPQ